MSQFWDEKFSTRNYSSARNYTRSFDNHPRERYSSLEITFRLTVDTSGSWPREWQTNVSSPAKRARKRPFRSVLRKRISPVGWCMATRWKRQKLTMPAFAGDLEPRGCRFVGVRAFVLTRVHVSSATRYKAEPVYRWRTRPSRIFRFLIVRRSCALFPFSFSLSLFLPFFFFELKNFTEHFPASFLRRAASNDNAPPSCMVFEGDAQGVTNFNVRTSCSNRAVSIQIDVPEWGSMNATLENYFDISTIVDFGMRI